MIISNTKYAEVKTEVPGPKSLDLFNEEINYIAPGIQTIATRSKIAIDKGEGCIVQDVDGNRYIDFFVGVGVASLGYNHPVYNKLMKEQLDNIHVGSFTSQNRVKLTRLLSEIAIGDLKWSAGGGIRIFMNNLILRVDGALSKEGFFTQMYVDHAF